ncbi:FAD-dependent oxidoreductase [Komagataeibacter rhaeticus]|nr:FAD-dependent oxidoreductase [Komagataeibacter rhaeticus]
MTDTAPSAPSLSSAARGLTYDVVVVGGGAAGLSTAASILKRRGGITVAIIEPSASHFYQPGWTLVGGGVFKQSQTRRSEKG